MQKNRKFFLLSIGLFLIFAGFYYVNSRIYSWRGNQIKTIVLGGEKIYAEVVSSKERTALGLGGRQAICSDCGMLFEFPAEGDYAFWMKNMKFPLDLIWISKGEIVHLEKNVSQNDKRIFKSQVPAQKVLEVNAGFCDKFGIRIGDSLFE